MSRTAGTGVVLCFVLLLGCAGGQKTASSEHVLLGRVTMVGNMPFVTPAIETDGGNVFLLQCDEKTGEYLRGLQGRRIRVTCTPGGSTSRGDVVIVLKVEESQ
jgi:hypothetical protein